MLNLHADTLARLKVDHLRAILIKLNTTPSAVFLTNTPFDVPSNGDTYKGTGQLLGLGTLKQTTDIRVSSTSLKLDAVDPSLVAVLLGNPQHASNVDISIAILNDDFSIAGNPIVMGSMIVDGSPKVTDNPTKGVALLSQKISSAFANWQAKGGRSTTPASQHKYFPNDTGFNFAAEAGKQYPWGRKK